MNKTREIIQSEALLALEKVDYNGTVVLSTGTGKSKIGIDAIKQGKFKNILITSPRTNLKENWKRELEKWQIYQWEDDIYDIQCGPRINIVLENIQTCYKWKEISLEDFDLIIADEIHTIVTAEYGTLIKRANEMNIPVIGLTATPDNKKEEKYFFYKIYCPIVYEYYDSARDGLINKRKYLVFKYDLSDEFTVTAGTKKKPFTVGEKTQYEYLSAQIRKGQQLMAGTGSEDWWNDSVNWFYKGNGDFDQKTAARVYLNAIKYRKEFLWNLTSSATYAVQIKERILANPSNKVLLFSENIKQSKKLSKYSIHSKQDVELNKEILDKFDSGEIKELSSVRSLTLGLNIKGANYIEKESFNGSEVNFQQQAGRSDRLDVDDIATVIWIVPVETQAEQWYNKAVKNIPEEELAIFTDINELLKEI